MQPVGFKNCLETLTCLELRLPVQILDNKKVVNMVVKENKGYVRI